MILGFDTATPATTVALWDPATERAFEARDDPPPGAKPAHTARLLELIVEVLDREAAGWPAVSRIAVGIGPGTFTGLRIGIATARALGQARAIPLVGISTLESLAFGVGRAAVGASTEAVVSVIDARRGEAFAAAWRLPGLIPALAPRALAPDALGELIPTVGAAPLAVGDGAIKFREVLERSGASVPEESSQLHRVTAINHCHLAGDRPVSPPHQILPQYLRLPDAELTLRSRSSR